MGRSCTSNSHALQNPDLHVSINMHTYYEFFESVVLQLELFREMATMGELPNELLQYIILLLVQSPGGAADFARIISVCQKFRLFAQDKYILEPVNFNIKMELKNFKRYQHINSLLVKCSEAGNVAAQFLLGKVILVSSSQLFLSEWQKVECDVHPCDFATLSDLSCILATNVPAQNQVDDFMTYFLPKEVSTSKLSQTRLVHHQLVKLFLLNGSPYDFIEMVVFLKCYIKYFTRFSGTHSALICFIRLVVSHACRVMAMEQLAKTKEFFTDPSMDLIDFLENPLKYYNVFNASSKKHFDEVAREVKVIFFVSLHIRRRDTVGMNWRTAMNDMDFLEQLRNDMSNRLDKAYSNFNRCRAKTLDWFDRFTQHVIQEM